MVVRQGLDRRCGIWSPVLALLVVAEELALEEH